MTRALPGLGIADAGSSSCRWCERSDLNATDRWFRDRLKADDPATVTTLVRVASGLVPLGTLGLDALASLDSGGDIGTIGVDALVIVEATSLALALTSIAKPIFLRQRPYALDVPADEFAREPRPYDENASFFSGHTAVGFALAVSSGTVASMRNYRLAPLVWGVGVPLATTAGALRIAQDEHYFTDLLGGALIGGGLGFAVPYFFHSPRSLVLSSTPVRGGHVVFVNGAL